MDRTVVKCPKCELGHRLPVGQQGQVSCQRCGGQFWTDTRVFDAGLDPMVREGLDPILEEGAPRDLSHGRQPAPIATPIKGGAFKTAFGMAEGVCPHCRHTMKVGVVESRCPRCDHYSMPRDGYLRPIAEDYVSATHAFNVPMGVFEQEELPPICCACGEAATRTIRHSVGFDVSVPHCKQHSVGAITSTEEGRFGLLVKSHRFYCVAMLRGGSLLF